jgi:hypothetical protein
MKRLVRSAVAAGALTLLFALPGTAQGRTLWVCQVPGEVEPVVFVSAADAALHGITRANQRAGETFSTKFGEECHVESG